MFGERQTRALLGPADPARDFTSLDVSAGTSPDAASDLILRLRSTADGPSGSSFADVTVGDVTVGEGGGPASVRTVPRPRRRLLAVTATVLAMAALGAAIVVQRLPESTDPSVVTPIPYRNDDVPPAAPQLLALADRITDTGYDGAHGRVVYHRLSTWGATAWAGNSTTSPDGHRMSRVIDVRSWNTGGTLRQRVTRLAPAFPDEASRRYWQDRLGPEPPVPLVTEHLSEPYGNRPPAATVDAVRPYLRADRVAGVPQSVARLYQDFVVPRPARAELLRVLAEEPGLIWRGEVTDRAGRRAVAVTQGDATQGQELLMFDPSTGELLSAESITTVDGARQVYAYLLILESGWTDTLG